LSEVKAKPGVKKAANTRKIRQVLTANDLISIF